VWQARLLSDGSDGAAAVEGSVLDAAGVDAPDNLEEALVAPAGVPAVGHDPVLDGLGVGGDAVSNHLDSVVAGEAAGLVGHVHTLLVAEEVLVHGEGDGDGAVDEGGHHGILTVHVVPALHLVSGQHLGRAVLAGGEASAAVTLTRGVGVAGVRGQTLLNHVLERVLGPAAAAAHVVLGVA